MVAAQRSVNPYKTIFITNIHQKCQTFIHYFIFFFCTFSHFPLFNCFLLLSFVRLQVFHCHPLVSIYCIQVLVCAMAFLRSHWSFHRPTHALSNILYILPLPLFSLHIHSFCFYFCCRRFPVGIQRRQPLSRANPTSGGFAFTKAHSGSSYIYAFLLEILTACVPSCKRSKRKYCNIRTAIVAI